MLVESPIQQDYASQALADVLKANFNPNLHLNEINPDENMFMRVDKTDLIVNSTEFCFTAMGHFEIESVGRVLREKIGTTASQFQTVASGKARVVTQLYDAYRETAQREFL
jgi:hypothetical protein